jgi:hypothetical protein
MLNRQNRGFVIIFPTLILILIVISLYIFTFEVKNRKVSREITVLRIERIKHILNIIEEQVEYTQRTNGSIMEVLQMINLSISEYGYKIYVSKSFEYDETLYIEIYIYNLDYGLMISHLLRLPLNDR